MRSGFTRELDSSNEFQTVSSKFPKETERRFNICISTFTDVQHIYWLPLVVNRWRGPISVSVFVRDNSELEMAKVLAREFKLRNATYDNVIFHVTSPVSVDLKVNSKVNWE